MFMKSLRLLILHTVLAKNKCVGPSHCRAEMYAGRVACCPLVSHAEYAPRALLRLEKNETDRDRRTDEHGQRNNRFTQGGQT